MVANDEVIREDYRKDFIVYLTPQDGYIKGIDAPMERLHCVADTAEDAAWVAYLIKRAVGWRYSAVLAEVYSGGGDQRFGLDCELAMWDTQSSRMATELGMWAAP